MAKLIVTLEIENTLLTGIDSLDDVKQVIGFLNSLDGATKLKSVKSTERVVNKGINKVTLTVTNELQGV